MIKIDNIYMAGQVIIVKGWSMEEADIKQEFATSILNDMIAAKGSGYYSGNASNRIVYVSNS